MIALEWKERQKKFYDDEGLEVIVRNVGVPKQYGDISARASNPLNYKIDGFVRRAARGTNANAYRCTAIQTSDGEHQSTYTLIIELYKILQR